MPERTCHHCGSPLEKGRAVPLRNFYTGGEWYSFCGELCRAKYAAEWKVILKREALRAAELRARLLELRSPTARVEPSSPTGEVKGGGVGSAVPTHSIPARKPARVPNEVVV